MFTVLPNTYERSFCKCAFCFCFLASNSVYVLCFPLLEMYASLSLCVCVCVSAASQQEGHGFDSRMGRCWLWGAGPPQTFSAQVGYLLDLSVWSLHVLPVFTRGFLH